MKKIFITSLFFTFFVTSFYSQNVDHFNGGNFIKRIEYNLEAFNPTSNLRSKDKIEKMFLGNFNAPIEFFYDPSFEAPSCFRLVRDTSISSYILELKYVSNYREAQQEASNKYELIGLSGEPSLFTNSEIDSIARINREISSKYYEELHKMYKIEVTSFIISNQFAEMLYKKMVSFLENFKARRDPPEVNSEDIPIFRFTSGGHSVTFRTVVEDEVWSLWIREPQGMASKMEDLCMQIIKDARNNQLDESKYISVLNSFEN